MDIQEGIAMYRNCYYYYYYLFVFAFGGSSVLCLMGRAAIFPLALCIARERHVMRCTIPMTCSNVSEKLMSPQSVGIVQTGA